ncbi:unnamed protein product [Rotaria sp. Silwood2]|nr:unnamed protein product [Rotaria sp. Silwood2]CAF2532616.1 unnamed protein product [Rotaria sp. Silwood2]CAF2785141.1 unnamed protein product [Rotaria sp. Silwood2]CAF2929772.1 unnamed protein product [Rotaria sp. Silwood2]CAF3857393.1 unnamed protein product [Rotaria sp. Silwood2]
MKMMANDERKLATSSLIPLEIDPVSILSLSKGVIFDTIVHNIEYTFNNRRTDPLPWKLVGMSLICDPSRNKKYTQKLQKMQCVPSVICTQIYHSKLVKTESGTLTTPGRKIVIPTFPRKHLTGIIVCRSIDELLYLESANTENVHFIQYKLLSYERIATRELVNGPKLPSIGDKIIVGLFQNNGFPRQLLPVAIISFTRQAGCDLCLSIRNFLILDEHKVFDKSYLVSSTKAELDRLREEQERKEDAEAEQELAWEKIQPRQPLADLSKKSTDTENAQPSPIPQSYPRVPPLKIKIPRPSLDSKYQCLLKLDRIDLSLYDISNLSTISQTKNKKPNESSISSDVINNKTKPFTISKSHEHHKPLKRLNATEPKKQSTHSSEVNKEKPNDKSISIRLSRNNVTSSLTKDEINRRSSSISSMSSINIPKRTVEKNVTKNKVKRPILPPEYHCSISLSRIDLSMYNLDLPAIPISTSTSSMNMESTGTTSPSNSTSSRQQEQSTNVPVEKEITQDTSQSMFITEQKNVDELPEQKIISVVQQFNTIDTDETLKSIMDEFFTPDINESLSNTRNIVLPSSTSEMLQETTNESILPVTEEISPVSTTEDQSQIANESMLPIIKEISSASTTEDQSQTVNESLLPTIEAISPVSTNEDLPQTINELLPTIINKTPSKSMETINEVVLPTTNEVMQTIQTEENMQPISPSQCFTYSPELPPLDDDPVVFSVESLPLPVMDISDTVPQDFLIIVPCSDDEDDIDDEETNKSNKDNKILESFSSPSKINISPVASNPSLKRVLTNTSSLNSHRSSTSSCSSISTSILQNQSPRLPLRLIEIIIPQKILHKKQHKPSQTITFNRFNLLIPLFVHEPLIDPRLIYRLQTLTTDLRWPSPCNQCSISEQLPSLFHSSTQMISYEQKCLSEFIDPRRESLKQAILNIIYQRIKILMPHLLIIRSNRFQTLLFEQTIFKTNCSIHLEYLLHKIKVIDDMNFFHMIKTQDEFQLSSSLLQLIFT